MVKTMMQAAALLVLLGALGAMSDTCTSVAPTQRTDCWPENYQNMNQQTCNSRGCCWDNSVSVKEGQLRGQPACYYPSTFGYTLSSRLPTTNGFTGTLTQRGDSPAPYGGDIPTLTVSVEALSDTILHFKLTDAYNSRYEVPISMPATPLTPPSSNPLFNVQTYSDPFGLAVVRTSTGQAIFNSSSYGGLIYSDQFLQISTRLASNNVYGLGEHVAPVRLSTTYSILSLFARDQGTPEGYTNLYGVHPFLLSVEPSGMASGIFLLNSNAIDATLLPAPGMTLRTIGGVLDFYMFLGPSVDNVIQQYTSVVGRPYFPPYWSLGFNLCRWGYNSADNTQAVVDAMRANDIPQDVQWNDIDYMNNHLDFTLDPNFQNLPDVVQNLHSNGQRYVMIVDPAISSTQQSGSYPPYDQGMQSDVFVHNQDGSVLVGQVWPGATVFPDFFHPNTGPWWLEQITRFYQTVPFDGLWIDMNEPSNFVQGSSQGCPSTTLDNPPYVPHIADSQLLSKTLCMSARHYNNQTHYNVHSLYGYSESVATLEALHTIRKKRTLVVSRSTFPGSGVYAAHWLGDNNPTWDDLRYSIAGILNFNIFGIPLVGADICGFGGQSSNAELCARWMQIGSFYPFSRNHNSINKPPQDPTAFGQQVIDISRTALDLRYTLLPYLYTLFYEASTTGTPVARALFFEFPTDPNTLGIDCQFMWGHALIITPVISQGATSVTGYFPAGTYYDVQTGERLLVTAPQYLPLDAPLEKINVHMICGNLVPTQQPATTTAQARTQPFGLMVALCSLSASVTSSFNGTQFFDDGESLDSLTNPADSLLVGYQVSSAGDGSSGSISGSAISGGYVVAPPLGNITVFGVNQAPQSVTVNNQPWTSFSYISGQGTFYITDLTLRVGTPFSISWK